MLMERDRDIIKFLEKYRGLTIKQAARLFFTSYSYAQKRLKVLEEEGLLMSHFNKIMNDKVYTLQGKISTHDLYVIELYSLLKEAGCTIEDFEVQYKIFKDQLRPDCFVSFIYENRMYFYFVEIEDTHQTTMAKFQTYEMYFKTGEMQEKCKGVFPDIILIGYNRLEYESENFGTVYMDFAELKDKNFIEKLV